MPAPGFPTSFNCAIAARGTSSNPKQVVELSVITAWRWRVYGLRVPVNTLVMGLIHLWGERSAKIRRGLSRLLAAGPVVTALRLARWAIPLVLAGALILQFTNIGWEEIWQSRPSSPVFYLLAILPFFVQPVADLVIYRRLWKVGKTLRLSILLRKRQLNAIMLDYSGEAYLFHWAQRAVVAPTSTLLHTIKDSNILSAAAGMATAILVLCLLIQVGDVRPLDYFSSSPNARLAAAVGAFPVALAVILTCGGSWVTTLKRSQVVWLFGVHLGRSMIALVIQFAAWFTSGALPSATHCLYFVALSVLVSRLPLLPHRNLIFAGSALAAAQSLELHTQSVAAVLVFTTAVNDILGFLLVSIPWLLSRSSPLLVSRLGNVATSSQH